MRRIRTYIAAVFAVSALVVHSIEIVRADDPLNAFPTPSNPVEHRIKQMTHAELDSLKIPERRDQVILSITMDLAPDSATKVEANTKPWLRVFADGRIDCGIVTITDAERREDTLTRDELTWLMHLALNKCELMGRATQGVEAEMQKLGKKVVRNGESSPRYFRYHVSTSFKENDVLIPENALVVRSLRAKLKLNSFASLNKYARFLASRPYLGTPKEREALLEQLNNKLKSDLPEIPAFKMEHLDGAITSNMMDLTAMFIQEIELAENKFKNVSGTIMRKEEGAAPTFSVRAMEYSKYKP